MIARIPSGYREVMSLEIPKFSLSSCPSFVHKISKLSIFLSHGLGCHTARVCALLIDRPGRMRLHACAAEANARGFHARIQRTHSSVTRLDSMSQSYEPAR